MYTILMHWRKSSSSRGRIFSSGREICSLEDEFLLKFVIPVTSDGHWCMHYISKVGISNNFLHSKNLNKNIIHLDIWSPTLMTTNQGIQQSSRGAVFRKPKKHFYAHLPSIFVSSDWFNVPDRMNKLQMKWLIVVVYCFLSSIVYPPLSSLNYNKWLYVIKNYWIVDDFGCG